MSTKIAVIGGGTLGIQAAYHLAIRGAEVTTFETATPGHARASAGGETRLFTSIDIADPTYCEVIARAKMLWSELNSTTGKELLTPTGALLIDSADSPIIDASHTSTMEHLHPLSREDAKSRYPHLEFFADDRAFIDPTAGFIRPELANYATSLLAQDSGATVSSGTRIASIHTHATGVEVKTESGDTDTFDRVIVAAGAWTTKLLPLAAQHIETRRLTSAWFFPAESQSFSTLTPFMRLQPDYFYGIPNPDKNGVKLGVGFKDHLPVADPDHCNRWPELQELELFSSLVDTYLPGLGKHPFHSATYFETYTQSRRELIDWYPGSNQRVLVAAGMSGHGFKVAPAIGEHLALLSLNENPVLDFQNFTKF